eukprot:EC821717.1.p1 GENE.EC821717.1~~EC821717.1.p1  ORF type:complete len:143 (+),score=44.81 EC821717.1:142-570(+)
MGKKFVKNLEGSRVYCCKQCGTHIAYNNDCVSKNFHGKLGKAVLMNSVVNFVSGKPVKRTLMTGVHIVADIFCLKCNTTIGWRYYEAYNESEKYKVGKFVLEKELVKIEKKTFNCLNGVEEKYQKIDLEIISRLLRRRLNNP